MMFNRPVCGERLIMMCESETSHRLGVRFENRQKFTSESSGNSDNLEISSLFVMVCLSFLNWSWVRDSDPRSPSYKEGAEPLCQPSIEM